MTLFLTVALTGLALVAGLALGIPLQPNNDRGMRQPVADGVRQRRIGDQSVPIRREILGRHDQLADLIPFFEDFQQIGEILERDGGHEEVVQDEHRGK